MEKFSCASEIAADSLNDDQVHVPTNMPMFSTHSSLLFFNVHSRCLSGLSRKELTYSSESVRSESCEKAAVCRPSMTIVYDLNLVVHLLNFNGACCKEGVKYHDRDAARYINQVSEVTSSNQRAPQYTH